MDLLDGWFAHWLALEGPYLMPRSSETFSASLHGTLSSRQDCSVRGPLQTVYQAEIYDTAKPLGRSSRAGFSLYTIYTAIIEGAYSFPFKDIWNPSDPSRILRWPQSQLHTIYIPSVRNSNGGNLIFPRSNCSVSARWRQYWKLQSRELNGLRQMTGTSNSHLYTAAVVSEMEEQSSMHVRRRLLNPILQKVKVWLVTITAYHGFSRNKPFLASTVSVRWKILEPNTAARIPRIGISSHARTYQKKGH